MCKRFHWIRYVGCHHKQHGTNTSNSKNESIRLGSNNYSFTSQNKTHTIDCWFCFFWYIGQCDEWLNENGTLRATTNNTAPSRRKRNDSDSAFIPSPSPAIKQQYSTHTIDCCFCFFWSTGPSVRATNVPLKTVRFAPQTTWRANTSNELIRLGSIPSLFTSHKNNNTKHTIDCCFCFFCSTQAIAADWKDLIHFEWW